MTNTFSLDDFRKHTLYRGFSGNLSLEYNDTTHLKKDEWCNFIDLSLDRAPAGSTFSDAEQSFTISLNLSSNISSSPLHKRVIEDLIKLALTRIGVIDPLCYPDLHMHLSELVKQDGIMLIPDTNVLNNGGLHWLLSIFRDSTVWILPFVLSLTQVQERDAKLKSFVSSENPKNTKEALRSRAMVNSSLGLLQRNRTKYQVLELDPTLLRYHRNTGKDGEGDVLEDRLLIEGIHAILRATRTRAAQRVVTSDVMMARILEAEGVPCLFVPSAILPSEPISNVHYRPFAKAFVGASLADLVWEMTHALGSVRIKKGGDVLVQLDAYWPHKNPAEWRNEQLVVEFKDNASLSLLDTAPPPPTDVYEAENATTNVVLSNAFLPHSSLMQVLRVAGHVPVTGAISVEQLVREYGDIDKGNAKRSLEILRRIGVIEVSGELIMGSEQLVHLDELLNGHDLDALDLIMQAFSPYKILRDALREQGSIAKPDIEEILRNASGRDVGKESSVRLAKYPILLGQAWSSRSGLVIDGTNRPSNDNFLSAFKKAFASNSRDSLASVHQVLLALCESLRISPWAAKRQWQRIAAGQGFAGYAMQPAAGQKPVALDRVIGGSIREPVEVAVNVDRIELGEKPVFTIEGIVR